MTRKKLYARIDEDLKAKIQLVAKTRGLSMNDLIEAAIYEYVNPEDYKTVSLEYLAGIEKKQTLLLKRVDLALETLGKYVLVWFMNTPEVVDEKLRIAMARTGRSRYETFIDKVFGSVKSKGSVRHAFEKRKLEEDDFNPGGTP